MMQFKFNCPQCGRMVETDDRFRGQVAECPYCGKGIVIPRKIASMSRPKMELHRYSSHQTNAVSQNASSAPISDTYQSDSSSRKNYSIRTLTKVIVFAVVTCVIICLIGGVGYKIAQNKFEHTEKQQNEFEQTEKRQNEFEHTEERQNEFEHVEKQQRQIEIDSVTNTMSMTGIEVVREAIAIIESNETKGTGFLLDIGGTTYLMSNEHVVRSGQNIEARLLDGTLLKLGAFSVANDSRDLARFEVLGCKKTPLRLRRDTPTLGEQVTVYGNSLGSGVATESKGFVLGIGPTKVETNAEIVSGVSGSPLLDLSNRVIGVAYFMELTDTGKKNWGNADTRYDGKVRRYAVRLNDTSWKNINRYEYEAQVRAFTEFGAFWYYLSPFLLLETERVADRDLVYNDLCAKEFNQDQYGFNDILKEVANAYEKRRKSFARWDERSKSGTRAELVHRLNLETSRRQQLQDALAEYDEANRQRSTWAKERYKLKKAIDNQLRIENDAKNVLVAYDRKTKNIYETMKGALREMILVRKKALNHAQLFLTENTWDAPQILKGYNDNPTRSVESYQMIIKRWNDLMDQKLKDLSKLIKEIEEVNDD